MRGMFLIVGLVMMGFMVLSGLGELLGVDDF